MWLQVEPMPAMQVQRALKIFQLFCIIQTQRTSQSFRRSLVCSQITMLLSYCTVWYFSELTMSKIAISFQGFAITQVSYVTKFGMNMTGMISQYTNPLLSSIQPVSSLNRPGKIHYFNSSFSECPSLSWAFTSFAVFIVILFSIAQNIVPTKISIFPVTFNPRHHKNFSVLQSLWYLKFLNPFWTKHEKFLNAFQYYLFRVSLYIVSFN